jgi:S1-C subfamily serine protease
MKQKVAPTSPKNKLLPEQNTLPQEQVQQSIQSVQRQSLGVWYFVAFFVVSLVGGFVAALLLFTQGKGLGLTDLQDFFQRATTTITRSNSRAYEERETSKGAFVDSVSPTILQLYSVPDNQPLDGSKFLTADQFVGYGFILTSDGVAFAPASVLADSSANTYVGLSSTGVLQPLENISSDSRSGLAFFTFSGNSLSVVDISDTVTIPLEPVTLLVRFPTDKEFFVQADTVRRKVATALADENAFYSSSEDYFSNTYLFQDSEFSKGTPVYRGDGTLLGLFDGSKGDPKIIFLPERKHIITEYLEKRTIEYPEVGLRGIDLSLFSYLEQKKAYANSKGFLVASSDDGSIQAVKKNSAAQVAGIKKGDVILECNHIALDSTHSLGQALLSATPGASIEFRIIRSGVEQTLTVTPLRLP